MASIQFVSPHREGVMIGKEPDYEVPVALSGRTLTSSDQATAWRLRRGGREKPMPHSKRTMGSLYNFDQ